MPIKKFFNTEILTAEDVNTYLMDQSVIVFANETARDAAFSDSDPSLPARGGGGRLCYLADRQVIQYWNGSSWVDSAQFTVPDNFITDAKINTAAAISDTKLGTISTAGKVANSATTATSANTANAIVARDASGNFSSSGATIDSVRVGITAVNEIDTTSGNLILDSAGGTITIDDNVSVSGSISVAGNAVYHISTASVASGGSLSVSNDGQFVELTGNSATLTVPGTGWTVGSQVTIMQMGTGSSSIAFTGATDIKATPRVSASVVALRTQYSTATIINRGTSDWYVIGDLRS